MTPLCFLLIVLLRRFLGAVSTVTTVGDLAVLEGGSVTVPCHYNPQYTQHVKYWCQGSMREFCTSLARTDDPGSAPSAKGRVTISDDPSQHVFAVTMRELTEADAGWYWCGVEVGGMWSVDSTASLYISVIHGISVVNSMVNGEEGGSVAVRCLYSEKHRESEKRWCRSGHMASCLVTDSTGTFSSRSVLIHDDRLGTVTVTMKRLEMRDAGWYWCGAGQQQVTVYVSVTEKQTTTSYVASTPLFTPSVRLTKQPSSVAKAPHSSSLLFWQTPLLVCGALLLLLAAVVVPWRILAQSKKIPVKRGVDETDAKFMVFQEKGQEWKNTPVVFLNASAQQVQVL
ncbi:polymeric immunoglobulin receptor [Brachyhypopomus gauderio]|uniref:polymeric immunoglobulin receptor n=1 Tax=Brachyhypopomus gauderio TaxID=698409 RepID=UPI0040435508